MDGNRSIEHFQSEAVTILDIQELCFGLIKKAAIHHTGRLTWRGRADWLTKRNGALVKGAHHPRTSLGASRSRSTLAASLDGSHWTGL
jgi:hypothetical protein